MKTNSLNTRCDDELIATFVEQIQIRPPEFISAGKDSSRTEENSELSEFVKEEENLFQPVKRINPLESFLKEAGTKPVESQKASLSNEQGGPFMSSFLVELVQCIKSTLASVYHVTQLTFEKFDDAEMRKHSQTQVKEDIKKIDSVLNSLLNFININTPIAKTNTLYTILEEILEANEQQLQDKRIRIIKRCEKDLPETYIHNEQVRFILHSILQYAIFSSPPNESIVFLMKSLDFRVDMAPNKNPAEDKEGYVEVVIGFNGNGKLGIPIETSSGMPRDQKEEAVDLILRLAEETLQKNHGKMRVEANGKRPNTLITLRFPIERRNVVYYAPITF